MRYLKLYEEYVKNPIPGDVPPEDQEHVFDFDDTIAVAKNSNAIALYNNGEPVHKSFGDVISWLTNLGLDKHDLIKGPAGKTIEETPHKKIWTAHVTSSALSKVSKTYNDKYVTGSGEIPQKGSTLVIDYTPSSFIGRAKPIDSVVDKLKKLNQEGAHTVVMTARKGEGEGISMDGTVVHASNKNDVKAYLKAHGITPDEVFGVTGKNKGEKIKDEFFDGKDKEPKEVHFYDDTASNIDAVKAALAGKVDAELFLYGPGEFAKKEADPNKPTSKYPAKKK